MQNDASGNDVLTSWPGGVGTLAKIPTGPVSVGGRRKTRRNRKNRNRKQTRKNRNRKSRRQRKMY